MCSLPACLPVSLSALNNPTLIRCFAFAPHPLLVPSHSFIRHSLNNATTQPNQIPYQGNRRRGRKFNSSDFVLHWWTAIQSPHLDAFNLILVHPTVDFDTTRPTDMQQVNSGRSNWWRSGVKRGQYLPHRLTGRLCVPLKWLFLRLTSRNGIGGADTQSSIEIEELVLAKKCPCR